MEDIAPQVRKLGRYSLLQRIATGGMGEVHIARLDSIQGVEKFFAIKLLLPQFVEEQSVVDMFVTEARIAARIAHPNVCQVFELGLQEDELFICMEYLRGVPATSILRAHKPANPVDLRIAVGIVQQAAHGLQFAHELCDEDGESLGVVHRDVSPGNIFITTTGAAKILDFGVVKAKDSSHKTKTGALKGKFGYMSPEQIMARELDNRSDIFSLGTVLFELLTNRRLFTRDSDYATLKAITESPIPTLASFLPGAPAELGAVLAKAMARDLDKRFASMKEFSRALSEAMSTHGGIADSGEISDFILSKFSHRIGDIDRMLKSFSKRSTSSAPIVARRRQRLEEATQLVDEGISVAGLIPAADGSNPNGAQMRRSPSNSEFSQDSRIGSEPSGNFGSAPGYVPGSNPGYVPGSNPGYVPGSNAGLMSAAGMSGAKSEVTALVYDASRGRRGSGMAIAVGVVGLGVIGLLAALLLNTDSNPQPAASSIIFEGSLVPERGLVPVPVDAAHEKDNVAVNVATPAVVAGSSKGKGKKSRRPCERESTVNARNTCYVKEQTGKMKRCLVSNSGDATGIPSFTLGFDLKSSGQVKAVSLSPPALASTSLGACLKRVSKQIRFGKQNGATRFRISTNINH